MSFMNVAGTSEREDIVQDIRRSTSKPTYIDNPYQIFENMDSDSQIPDLPVSDKPETRSTLIDLLEPSSPTDDTETLKSIRMFCHDHTQEGEEDNVAGGATLGSVHDLVSLADHVYATSGKTLAQVLIMLRKLVRIKDPAHRLNLQQARLASIQLSPYQKWSFYDDYDLDDPLAALGDSREAAVVRLGLGFYEDPAIELIRWTHRLPTKTKAYKPTAWDADAGEWSVYWRPGGKTYPTRPDFGDGLPEVVHDPITAQEFVTAAEPLET